jgi:hypothetical protein
LGLFQSTPSGLLICMIEERYTHTTYTYISAGGKDRVEEHATPRVRVRFRVRVMFRGQG